MIPSRDASRTRVAILLAAFFFLCACRSTTRAREHVEKGNQDRTQGEFSAAENEYRQAIEISPDLADAYYGLGLLQAQEDHPTAARQSFEHTVSLDSRNPGARLQLGDLLIASAQYPEARQQAESLLQQDPKNAGAHRLLGQIALHQAQFTAAENELQQAIAIDPRNPQFYEDLGLAQMLDSEFGAAEKSFQSAIGIKPDDPQTYINLASFYKGQNNVERAEQSLKDGISRNQKAVELPIALADLYLDRNRSDDAKHILDQVEGDQANYVDGRRAVAEFYLDNGDANSALDRFRNLVTTNPEDQGAVKKVAECYLQLHLWQEAGQWLDQHDRDHRDPDFRLLRSRSDLGAFRLREATDELLALIRDSPDLPAVYFYLAQVYLAQENTERAQKALMDAIRVQPGFLPALLGLGNISLQQNNASQALAYASQIIATSFWVADAHVIAGSAYLLLGDLNQAQRAFDLAAGLNPRSPAPLERQGKVLALRGRDAEAEKAYESALAIAPDYSPALAGLAETLGKEGKSRQANARMDHQIAAQPKAFQLYVAKAEFCIAQKDWGCAEHSYQQTLALNPFYVNGYLALAHIYAATNRPQGMIQEYEAAKNKFPQYLPTYILLGQVYEYVGDIDRARQTYQDALKVDQNSYQSLSSLASLYANHGGSLSEALDLAQKAKAQQPEDPGVNDTLGWIYYKQGFYNTAIPVLQAAASKSPQVAKFQFHLGMAFLAAGQPAQARTALQGSLQAGLAPEEAKAAQDALQKTGS